MIIPANLYGAPFDLVLDVGGNVGVFAELAREAWPGAAVYSFEPIPGAAQANRERSRSRWTTYEIAISDAAADGMPLFFCRNQHSASTMQTPGTARSNHFDIVDRFETLRVETQRLDRFLPLLHERDRVLVKVDVEGHELHVLRGAPQVLDLASTVIVEVQNDPTIFLGSPATWQVDDELRRHGLQFAGLVDAFSSPRTGEVLQFDGVWTRAIGPE